jgi:hypothetical protein
MKLFKDIYKFLIGEQSEPKLASKPRALANAIKKRNPISFFYNGPRNQVQAGRRVKVEVVALGVSKKGNMIIRGWVQPPSRSKTGFSKNNWRTFMVSRLTQVEIFDEETFDTKRPGYKEGDDKSMLTTYVTSDWSSTPDVPKDTEPTSEPQQTKPSVEPQQTEPSVEPQQTEPSVEPQQSEPTPEPQQSDLPKPEPENKPSIEPPKVDDSDDNEDEEEDETNDYDGLNENIKRIKRLLY